MKVDLNHHRKARIDMLPLIDIVFLLLVVFERNFLLIFVAIGTINWLDMARIVRGQTLSLREREFVEAARLTGVSTLRIIFRHIAPNLIGIVVVYVTLTIPQAILVESFLSFLGLGVQEPQTSLGALVNVGVAQMESAPWMLLIPATLLALILLCFNFLGDGLRDASDLLGARSVVVTHGPSPALGATRPAPHRSGPARTCRTASLRRSPRDPRWP